MSSSVVYTFNIHNRRKTHGYVYSPIDRLYHLCDRHNIKKNTGQVLDVSKWFDEDLRGIIDLAEDKIPIAAGNILTPSTGEIRPRDEHDYFTYEMEYPARDSVNSVHLLSRYLSELIPKKRHYELLRYFLHMSLIHYAKDCYIVVKGSPEANTDLINILLMLDPIIKRGRHTLFCETNINRITLDEVHQARIVLCDIGDRTIRTAQPFPEKSYERPIQYHGIVFQRHVPTSVPELKSRTINITTVPSNHIFTSGDVLAWILSYSNN